MTVINYNWKHFHELSTDELYEILKLRQDIFILEQECHYADLDGVDKDSLHLLMKEHDVLIGYLRVQITETAIHFGRVCLAKSARGHGIGKGLIEAVFEFMDNHQLTVPLEISSAQRYLEKFYKGFGFISEGEPYDDAGIEHIAMTCTTHIPS